MTVSAPTRAAAVLKVQEMGYEVLGDVSDRTLFSPVSKRAVAV